jgi:hypothetical protein
MLLALGVAQATGVVTPPPHPNYQWHTFIGGDPSIAANEPASAVDAGGNLYITGHTTYPWNMEGAPGAVTPTYYGYVTKINPAGQIQWNYFFPGIDPNHSWLTADISPRAITLDKNGNIWIAGTGLANGSVNLSANSFVMEVDPNGNELGAANFGRAICSDGQCSFTVAYGITYDPAGDGIYITGQAALWWVGGTMINGLPPYNAMFILQAGTGSAGVGLSWVGFYYTASGGNTWGQAITVDSSSNLYVAGVDGGEGSLWKVNANSPTSAVWEQLYGAAATGNAVTLYNGNLYVTGITATGFTGPLGQAPINPFVLTWGWGYDGTAFVESWDTGGNYRWLTFYNGSGKPVWGDGIGVNSTGVYVCGPGDLVGYNGAAPQNPGVAGAGHFILQLDLSGNYVWHSLYGVNRYDEASTLATDSLLDVYVSGYSSYGAWDGDNNTPPLSPGNSDASDIFIMKFSQGAATTTVVSQPTTVVYSPNPQNVALSATVTSTAGIVNSGSVTFTLTLMGATVTANVINGTASTTLTVPGGTPSEEYVIDGVYNPGPGFATSSYDQAVLGIAQATPVITWANPADIRFGSALGPTQLDAAANVAGSFTYNPLAGTVLPVGNGQPLEAIFTPTDTNDYTTVFTGATINVLPTATQGLPAQLVVTKTLARDRATQQVLVTVAVANTGGTAAQNVQVTLAKINTTATITALPVSLGAIGSGGVGYATLRFPANVGTSGAAAALTVGGTYTGGSFSGASRITLP